MTKEQWITIGTILSEEVSKRAKQPNKTNKEVFEAWDALDELYKNQKELEIPNYLLNKQVREERLTRSGEVSDELYKNQKELY